MASAELANFINSKIQNNWRLKSDRVKLYATYERMRHVKMLRDLHISLVQVVSYNFFITVPCEFQVNVSDIT